MPRQLGFWLDTDRCVQCHACEVACKSWNEVELGLKWRRVASVWEGGYPAPVTRAISYSCMHCATPACAAQCPQGAIAKRADDGVVLVDRRRCIGCRTCEAACPFGIPQYGKQGTMEKCGLCLDRVEQGKQPSCVATCPGEALKFGALDDLARAASAKGAERLGGPTGPSLLVSGRLKGAAVSALLGRRE